MMNIRRVNDAEAKNPLRLKRARCGDEKTTHILVKW